MPIEHFNGGTVFTGNSIEYFRLCVLRQGVGLEMKGIRVRRGPWIWKAVAKEFGIIPATKQNVHRWLCAKVDELRLQQEHIQK